MTDGKDRSAQPLVRGARPGDAEFIADANLQMAWETEQKRLDAVRLRAGVRAALADPERGRYFVAEFDGEPAGCLLVTREWSDWRNCWMWWIQSVYVRPQARRRGVYRALHECVRRAARDSGEVASIRLYVDRQNAAAVAVYRSLGMSLSNYDLMEEEIARSAKA